MTNKSTCTTLLLTILMVMGCLCASAQINVLPGQTALALAQKLTGQGVIVSNASLRCPAQANGMFKVVSSNLGLDSGIVLTTGRAATQGGNYGVNGFTAFLASNNNGAPGDASLTTLAGQETLDACSLEFDVVPNGDTIMFDYIFSSEEYINAVCGPYNDAFAFFISGPGIATPQNMALVPGTNIPVTINTINNGIPGATGALINCTSMGAGSPFTAYYINNNPGASLTHQGFTKVLQAKHSVTPCGKYHLKMVIADAGNALYDSGVFLKAGSLQTSDYSVQAIAAVQADTSAFCVKNCLPGVFMVKRAQADPAPATVRLVTTGTAITGLDYIPLPDSVVIPANASQVSVLVYGLPTPAAGTKTLKLMIYPPLNCSGNVAVADSASMLIYDTVHIAMLSRDTMLCRADSIGLAVSGYDFLTYQWLPAAGVSDPSTKDPVIAPATSTLYTVYAHIPGSTCPAETATVSISIKPTPDISLHADTTVCYNQQLRLPVAISPESAFFSYRWSGPDAFSSTMEKPVIDSMNAINAGTYTLLATNDTNGCSAVGKINVVVDIPAVPTVSPLQVFCLNSRVATLQATGADIRWYSSLSTQDTGSTFAPYANTDHETQYTYYVSQAADRCESPKEAITVAVKKCCDGNVFIPNAFTPNGSVNKIFRPVIDYGYTISGMYIYNRWGQAVYTSQEGTWDGTYGGIPADAGTYFYRISLKCITGGTTERVGDVVLIR